AAVTNLLSRAAMLSRNDPWVGRNASSLWWAGPAWQPGSMLTAGLCGKAAASSRGFINGDAPACRGVEGEGRAVPIDWVQVLGPLVLRVSATVSRAAEMPAHSTSMACSRLRRGCRLA